MFLGSTRNGAGTVVHNYRCDTCSTGFSVTGISQVINRPCRLPGCASYDAATDIDLALSQGAVSIRAPDGRSVLMRQRPLDPNRTEFLQRTGNRKHPVAIIRRMAPAPPASSKDHVEVNLVAATCKACGLGREFTLDAPLRSAAEIHAWLKTTLTPCPCGHREAEVAMRLVPAEPPAN